MSNDTLILDVVQAAELKYAFERNGWTNADIKALSGGNVLAKVRDVILGRAQVTYPEHAIDCDADPFVPDGWKVEEHTKGGIFTWDTTKVKLYLSKKQKGESYIIGNDLRWGLSAQPVLNANVLDYLLKPEHQHLIPEEWKGKEVFFWGTTYRHSDDRLYVRYLYFHGGRWCWNYRWLFNDFDSYDPAVARAS